jgi:hypothetical protein
MNFCHKFCVEKLQFNPLKPNGYYICLYHLLYHTKTMDSAHKMCSCVSYGAYCKKL